MALAPLNLGQPRRTHGWPHVRLSAVVPIGIIVAVAIVCVVVAVLGSAQRADEVALATGIVHSVCQMRPGRPVGDG